MKAHLTHLFEQALEQLKKDGLFSADTDVLPQINHTRDARFGDFACNLAMQLAKPAKQNPRVLAEKIIAALPASEHVDKVEIAGPGFINIFVHKASRFAVINQILEQKADFGRSQIGQGQSVQVEFISANPTGPLHVGHGRGAAYGAALASLLRSAGFQVSCEYYVNDAGRQMDILATSVWLRYLDFCGESFAFPSNGYQGDYVQDIAATLHRENAGLYHHAAAAVFADVPADTPDGGDKELHIDGLIKNAQQLLGDKGYRAVFDLALNTVLADIKRDTQAFGVNFDQWFSERSLTESGIVEKSVNTLKEKGFTYEQNGALWFRSTEFGDEKDRVLVRDDGRTTYFASDVAYHLNKLERGFDKLINIWGADHHGYVPRVRAAMTALGAEADKLTVLLVQFASLWRGKEKLQMSTRSGEFVTLRELRKEVGKDAARFFYVLRKSEQHMDFDLELAKSRSNDNPVYYIQYAHARVSSVFRQLQARNLVWLHDPAALESLNNEYEQALLTRLSKYGNVVETAAKAYEPHQIAYYLRELANEFHTFYNAHQFIVEDEDVRNARLSLIEAVQQVLRNGLAILGVSAPDEM